MRSHPSLTFGETPPVPLGTLAGVPAVPAAASVFDRREAMDFVAGLAGVALGHRAVRHPYLSAMAADLLPDPHWALADFARHYQGYSRQFPRYLLSVTAHLEHPRHRRALLDNLAEESGRYAPAELAALEAAGLRAAWFVGVPHPELFRRFTRAVGADTGRDDADGSLDAPQVQCWREMLLCVLNGGSPAEAVGAIGLGTETIVRSVYRPFVVASTRLGLRAEDTVFFALHTLVDDDHQLTLLDIAADLARTATGRDGLQRGMLKALQLRSTFWDWLYERALNPTLAECVA
jgi:pyrroloquinoline quinone (PQQ) biosynthesis protein C